MVESPTPAANKTNQTHPIALGLGVLILIGILAAIFLRPSDRGTDAPTGAVAPESAMPVPAPVGGAPAPVPQDVPSAKGTAGPSLDCSKARSQSEHLICDDPDLANSDRNYSDLYVRAKSNARDPRSFAATQENEWRIRNACSTKGCIADWYKRRSAQLAKFIDNGGLEPPADENVADQIRRIDRAIAYYALAKGETDEEFIARLHSGRREVAALLFAAEELGVPFEETLKALDGFSDAMRDPEKVKLVECLGVKVYEDPQPAGHPPSPAECQAIKQSALSRASDPKNVQAVADSAQAGKKASNTPATPSPQVSAADADSSSRALYPTFLTTITNAGYSCASITSVHRSAKYDGWRVTCGSESYALVDVGVGHWMADRD